MPESYFLYNVLPFGELKLPHRVLKLSFLQQPEAKLKLQTVPPESYFLYHLRGHFLPPKSGTVSNFQGGTISNFHFAIYVFPCLRLIGFF